MALTGRVEKRMSLSLAEFQNSFAPLLGRQLEPGMTAVSLALGQGLVVANYERLESRRFGGLLELPQALVSLTFEDVSAEDQARFVRLFDLAFQRGGG